MVEAWPVDVIADDARLVERLKAHEPAMGMPHASAPTRSTVAELEHKPIVHDHEEFLARARRRRGFPTTYDALETEYQVASELISARARAGLTQDIVAQRMGTTKSAISRLERAGRHTPSLGTLQRYAEAVGCELRIEFVPEAG